MCGNTCCDTTTECNGIECGTGVCGGDCPNTCAVNEICSENTCECDIENECNDVECGIGFCGGDCPNSCGANETCDTNICICDFSNECNGLECGSGFCGRDCPNTCAPGYICNENKCSCPLGFAEFAGNCIDCPATFSNCIDCTLTACTYCCSNNYHLENGQCVLDTVFGYDNFSISMPDFFFSPNSNNFKEVDNEVLIENCSDILSNCLLMGVGILLFFI